MIQLRCELQFDLCLLCSGCESNQMKSIKFLLMEWICTENISLLSVVEDGMGKTILLQQVYEDELAEEFDLKMWVCVSNNYDVKKSLQICWNLLRRRGLVFGDA
ncbi:hypothetical protein KFK09_013392 [Dendrobium nobile]|uniref:NB-ARC domain-containing protein n=1 Tax=Dendrobium nobile TaxID=94219 RepID=A0A8T3B728_DENNO|nr:hypothetical protein KFK09_013392 [Dendrobium nobile]